VKPRAACADGRAGGARLKVLAVALLGLFALRVAPANAPVPVLPAPDHTPPAVASAGRVLLWKVTPPSDAGGVLYLLGDARARREPVSELDPVVEAAFQSADVLVVEVNTLQLDEGELGRQAYARGVLRGGQSLPRVLGPELYARLSTAVRDLGYPAGSFDAYEPWLASLTLSSSALVRLGYDPRYGLDRYLLERARMGKRVVALESGQRRIELLDGMAFGAQRLLLAETLDEIDRFAESLDEIFAVCNAGDASALERIVFAELRAKPELEPLYERVYFERNRSMAKQLEASLLQGGRWFAVVGAEHLIGEHGIPNLLRQRGFRVEQVRRRSAIARDPV